ncbi:MAG: hypothetical protein NZM94_16070, partial [Roseiflexus sp.]|nr:hypothetical protein [Roseiflexus sp.]
MKSNRFQLPRIVAILAITGMLLSLTASTQVTPANGSDTSPLSSITLLPTPWQTIDPGFTPSATSLSVSAPGPERAASLYLPLVMRERRSPTPTPSPSPTPTGGGSPSPPPGSGSPEEWSQHAHDAQRTGYTPQTVPYPWRWRWSWNGPNASGGIAKVTTGGSLPRNVQPV